MQLSSVKEKDAEEILRVATAKGYALVVKKSLPPAEFKRIISTLAERLPKRSSDGTPILIACSMEPYKRYALHVTRRRQIKNGK